MAWSDLGVDEDGNGRRTGGKLGLDYQSLHDAVGETMEARLMESINRGIGVHKSHAVDTWDQTNLRWRLTDDKPVSF